jgi:hypothetical protein
MAPTLTPAQIKQLIEQLNIQSDDLQFVPENPNSSTLNIHITRPNRLYRSRADSVVSRDPWTLTGKTPSGQIKTKIQEKIIIGGNVRMGINGNKILEILANFPSFGTQKFRIPIPAAGDEAAGGETARGEAARGWSSVNGENFITPGVLGNQVGWFRGRLRIGYPVF